jgi:tRNA-intron endonuclease
MGKKKGKKNKGLKRKPKHKKKVAEPRPIRREKIDAFLEEGKVVVFDNIDDVYDPGCFGKEIDNRLELALTEACLLVKRGAIRVLKDEAEIGFDELYKHACKIDKRFVEKYRIYEELRERGLLVRTGLKFGCDFRVYDRGVKLKRGPKGAREHTKWIVYCIPEDYTCAFQDLSRSVRLAHNIRAKMLWAIVDNEGDVTYYEIVRRKP